MRGLRECGQCDCYLLFTNRKLTALKEEQLCAEMRGQAGLERVAILGRETITTYLEGAPEVAEAAGLWLAPVLRGGPRIPPAKRDFTGRTEELVALRREIAAHGGALIYGVRGLGTTPRRCWRPSRGSTSPWCGTRVPGRLAGTRLNACASAGRRAPRPGGRRRPRPRCSASGSGARCGRLAASP